MVAMLWAQHDDIWWISNEAVGSYYYISTPFIVLGMLYHVKAFLACIIKKKKPPLDFVIAIWFAAAFFVGCNIDIAKYYKVNFIHIPIIIYSAMGLISLCKLLKRWKYTPCVAVGLYVCSFGCYLYSQATFGVNYDNYGHSLLSHMHWYKYEAAIDRAEELTDGDISIYNLNYANLMLHTQMSPWDYLDQVVYDGNNEAFRTVTSIGRYHFNTMPEEGTDMMVCVYPYAVEEELIRAGYTIERVTQCYGVAYKAGK